MGLTPHPPRCWLAAMGRAVISAAAVALSLALPAGAWACNNPEAQSDGGDPPGGTGPGETVYFVLSNVDETATWEARHKGNPNAFASGTVESQGSGSRYRATFSMPDLGSQNETVDFDMRINHPIHGSWDRSFTVKYRGTPASPTPPPPHTVDEPATPQPRPVPERVRAPTGNQPVAGGGSFPAGGTGGVPPSGPAGSGGGPATPSSPVAPAGGPSGATGTGMAVGPELKPERAGQVAAPRASAAFPDRATDGTRPALRAASGVRAGGADGTGPVVLVIAALTVAGLAGALVLRWRRGGSGQAAWTDLPLLPSDLAAEAELQEMIAEERARLDGHRDESSSELISARDDPG
jgi:hypothetical protein